MTPMAVQWPQSRDSLVKKCAGSFSKLGKVTDIESSSASQNPKFECIVSVPLDYDL